MLLLLDGDRNGNQWRFGWRRGERRRRGGGGCSCESACGYYLRCKAADTADNRALCNQRCVAQGYTSQQLSDFQQMDCPHAVAAIDGTSSSSSSGSSCTGCVWDGSSCIYLTGSGGNYFACDRSCCP